MSATSAHARPVPEPGPKGAGWIRRMMPFLMAHKRNVLTAFAVAVVGQGVAGLVPVWSRQIVDHVILPNSKPQNAQQALVLGHLHREALAPWLLLLFGSAVLTFAL